MKLKFLILIINLFINLFLSITVYATTYYIAGNPGPGGEWGNGSDSNDGLSKSAPFLTLRHSFGVMTGGDELVIADGIYTGDDNMIDTFGNYGGVPPEGSSSAYTIVRAEHDGQVVLDGEGARRPILIRGDDEVDGSPGNSPSHDYIIIKGIVCKNSNDSAIIVVYCNHVKLINCGVVDPAGGNTSGIQVNYSSYCLIEGCYGWGSGRYKFSTYHAHHTIFRNCVSRFDRSDPQEQPIGDFTIYSGGYNEVQNCIAIDGGDPSYYGDYTSRAGAFGCPSTSDTDNKGPINFTNCFTIKGHIRFTSTDWNAYAADAYFNNCVGWDYIIIGNLDFIHAQGNTHFNHCTFGDIDNASDDVEFAYYNGWKAGNTDNSINSIYYNFLHGDLIYDVELFDYNNVYGLSSGYDIVASGPSDTNTITFNPRENGLLYLPRIESGSPLMTAGLDGERVGAEIIYQYGKSGTLYGEDGYNELQDGTNGTEEIKLWPFPNEDIIKEHMKTYSYDNGNLTGDRGFCVDGNGLYGGPITLTSYIWEYLGNPCPDEICGGYSGCSDYNGDQTACEANSCVYCSADDTCNATECCGDDPNQCADQTECEGAGWHWCDGACQADLCAPIGNTASIVTGGTASISTGGTASIVVQ